MYMIENTKVSSVSRRLGMPRLGCHTQFLASAKKQIGYTQSVVIK
jgi:hypothetical protein